MGQEIPEIEMTGVPGLTQPPGPKLVAIVSGISCEIIDVDAKSNVLASAFPKP